MTKIILILKSNYQAFKPDAILIRTWTEILKNYPAEEVYRACMRYMASPCPFAPKVGEIREIILAARKLAEPTSHEVFARIVKLAQGGAKLAQVERELGDNYKAKTALTIVGYDSIRMGDLETQLPYHRKAFIDAYDAIEARQGKNQGFCLRELPSKVQGLIAGVNNGKL